MASDTRPPLPPEWARVRQIGDAEGYARAIADVCAWLRDETPPGVYYGPYTLADEIEARFGARKGVGDGG